MSANKEGATDKVVSAPLDAAEREELVKFDLTKKMTPFLDRHLLFRMLHFLKELTLYKETDITRAEILLLEETNMIDFAVDKYGELGEEAPDALVEKREQILEKLQSSREQEIRLLETLEDEESVKKMATMKTVAEVCEAFDVTQAQIDGLVTYAKLQFDCGNYALSAELLKHYRNIVEKEPDRMSSKMGISCIWGAIASALLNNEFEDAADNVATLNDLLETSARTPKREVLLHKTWLLHWSLSAIFSSDNVPIKIMEFFLHDKSLSVISLSCPHLFRYVSACLILNKRLKSSIKEVVWVIQQETESYSDPITRFLVALYIDLDFDRAQKELQECKAVCKADFFLSRHWADFQENARLQIFETYCRIHQSINIDMIASRLDMKPNEAELWIVKLIQNAKLDARIDSEKGRVVMSKAPPSVYHQVIEKTKNLSFRSTMLLSNLEKRENEMKSEKAEGRRGEGGRGA